MVMHKLRSDKRIHDVLVDLTGLLLDEDEEDKEDRLEMEIYIVFNLSLTRPSIKLLLNEYPEYFKLNQAFYLDALNEKKTDFLMDKYAGIYKRLRASAKDDDEYFGDFKTGERIETVRREAPKIGRNDPCPCGSGKKYKKCCG
ncbi:MAG: SEC-C domain-containing protein [Treponema sp.]|nr:SEC-C domain-containing protein [Treponema sp.]